MAILIVDDELSTRTALRELLAQTGYKTIFEARHGEEALKIALAEKNRLRLMIADWEMPQMDGLALLDQVAQIPELDLTPFLLITSDLPRAKLKEIQQKTDRLDAFLIKPFRLKALIAATHAAQTHRAITRNTIVVFEGERPLLELTNSAHQLGRILVTTQTAEQFRQALTTHSRRLGAVIIRPHASLTEILAPFSRSPLGTQTPIVCASLNPEEVFPVRLYCQAFLPPDVPSSRWEQTLRMLETKAGASLELDLLFQSLKEALQRKATVEALQLARSIIDVDSTNAEAHATIGDLLVSQNNIVLAVQHYQQAIQANPCLPRPYIGLLALTHPTLPEVAEAAIRFCPHNQAVLFAAACALKKAGHQTRPAGSA
ncbi:response regulator [Bdellovibrionota bacterium FG-1]